MSDTSGSPSPGSADWPDSLDELAQAEVTPRRAELHRLADAARAVIHGLVSADVDVGSIADAADHLERVAELFSHSERRSLYEGFAESANSGNPYAFFDHSPMIGLANPLAPPLRLTRIDGSTIGGKVTFNQAYEGPPGNVHGGYIAAAFDELLGATQSLSGQQGMTGELIVRYRSPTPLHEPLTMTGVVTGTERRKVFTSGQLHVGDRLCAEATATFIAIDFAKYADLKERREAQARARDTSDS